MPPTAASLATEPWSSFTFVHRSSAPLSLSPFLSADGLSGVGEPVGVVKGGVPEQQASSELAREALWFEDEVALSVAAPAADRRSWPIQSSADSVPDALTDVKAGPHTRVAEAGPDARCTHASPPRHIPSSTDVTMALT